MTMEWRRWPRDQRFIACANGQVVGPSGVPLGTAAKTGHVIITYRTPEGRKSTGAHVIVCEAFHGPCPAEGMEVAHGNGDASDNRPENLRWDTSKGNQRDRVSHRTNGRKLTNEDVAAIRAGLATGETRNSLAFRFNVTPGTISHISTGHSWSNLPAA